MLVSSGKKGKNTVTMIYIHKLGVINLFDFISKLVNVNTINCSGGKSIPFTNCSVEETLLEYIDG